MAIAAAVGAAALPTASADTSVDKATQAVDAARRKGNALAEQQNKAETELADSEQLLAETQGRLEVSKQKAALTATKFRDSVVLAYVQAGSDTVSGDSQQRLLGDAYLRASSGRATDSVDELRAANLDLAAARKALDRRLEAQGKALSNLRVREAAVIAQLGQLNQAVTDARRREAEAIAAVRQAAAADKARAEAAAIAATADRKRIEAAAHVNDAGAPSGPWTCPVQGPHSFSNDFGAPRYGGGYHRHQGNDLIAPRGVPVVANVSGTYSRSINGLGGFSYHLQGDDGILYYGAHLDHYSGISGGRVSQGTVLGYVGNSGDARGGVTHLHFEMHPGGGAATNPYPYLIRYC